MGIRPQKVVKFNRDRPNRFFKGNLASYCLEKSPSDQVALEKAVWIIESLPVESEFSSSFPEVSERAVRAFVNPM